MVLQRLSRIVRFMGVAEIDVNFFIAMLHLLDAVKLAYLSRCRRRRKFSHLHLGCILLHDWSPLWRCVLFVVDFLFFFIFKAIQVLLFGISFDLRWRCQFIGELIIGIKLSIALVDFWDDLQVGGNFILGGSVELILNDAEQSFIELQQGVYLVFVGAAHFFQFLQFFLTGTL